MCPEMCQAMQEIIEDVRNEYIQEINKQRAETNEAKANEEKAKANEEKAKAEIIFLKERIAQLEKIVKDQAQ